MRKFGSLLILLGLLQFPSCFISGVKAQASFSEGSGIYGTLLNDLKKSLYENGRVKKVTLDGKVYGKNYITHSDLMKGGKLQFDMTKTPNKTRGTSPESFPYSFSNKKN